MKPLLRYTEQNISDILQAKFGDTLKLVPGTFHGIFKPCRAVCTIHGEFQLGVERLIHRDSGCGKCGHGSPSEQGFMDRVLEMHGPNYTVVPGTFTKLRERVTMECKKHGQYIAVASNVVTRNNTSDRPWAGCRKCQQESTILPKEEFVAKAKALHGDRYNYDKTVYLGALKKVEIFCNSCERYFWIRAADHTSPRKHGCSQCVRSKGEREVEDFLIAHGVSYTTEWSDPRCINPKTGWRLRFDFFLPTAGQPILIEYDGRQHRDPRSNLAGWGKESLESLQARDRIKDEFARTHGFDLLRIPHTKIRKIPEILAKKLGIEPATRTLC